MGIIGCYKSLEYYDRKNVWRLGEENIAGLLGQQALCQCLLGSSCPLGLGNVTGSWQRGSCSPCALRSRGQHEELAGMGKDRNYFSDKFGENFLRTAFVFLFIIYIYYFIALVKTRLIC